MMILKEEKKIKTKLLIKNKLKKNKIWYKKKLKSKKNTNLIKNSENSINYSNPKFIQEDNLKILFYKLKSQLYLPNQNNKFLKLSV